MLDVDLLTPAPTNANSLPKPKILIVDDNPGLRRYVAQHLLQQNFDVSQASGGMEMSQVLKQTKIDLIVLDSIMPDEDGLSICKRLREQNGPPIIMLSAKSEDGDRICGLDAGADDYMAKPFNPDELVARIRAVLRRRQQVADVRIQNVVHFLGWSLDISKRQLTSPGDKALNLSSSEFALMSIFLENRGQTLNRNQILAYMQELREDTIDCALDTLISRFRRKISQANPDHGPELICTKYGVGYMMPNDDVEA